MASLEEHFWTLSPSALRVPISPYGMPQKAAATIQKGKKSCLQGCPVAKGEQEQHSPGPSTKGYRLRYAPTCPHPHTCPCTGVGKSIAPRPLSFRMLLLFPLSSVSPISPSSLFHHPFFPFTYFQVHRTQVLPLALRHPGATTTPVPPPVPHLFPLCLLSKTAIASVRESQEPPRRGSGLPGSGDPNLDKKGNSIIHLVPSPFLGAPTAS